VIKLSWNLIFLKGEVLMLKKFFTKVWSAFLVLTLMTASIPFQASAANVVNSNFEAYFSNYNTSLWESASWANGNPFNCTWKPSQVTFSNGKMVLNLNRDSGGQYPYKSGEYRTTQFFGFGYYEVRMKATKNIGVVSSFFTYTGPSDNNPWDEIDIEFLGKDTTKVQYNWYKDGKANNEYMYSLGFDASQAFHTYGFEWRSSYISYYVDGKKVYTGTRNIPQTPGKIMMNLWPGTGVNDWLGAFDGRTPLTAEYEYVKYYPNGVPQQTVPPTPTRTPNTPTPYQPSVLVGDVNGDGGINSIDFGYYRMYLLGSINDFPVANDLKAGDLDGNRAIDSIDFGYMRSYLLGRINIFPAS
jgi:beta-glucanase (GH16 family)